MSALIVQDFAGAHNADLRASGARLLKGGSWKRQSIVVVIPAADLIPAKVALSHWNLAFPPNNGVMRILAQGMEVGDAYSTAIEQILAHPELSMWPYLCCIEHDNLPPSDGVLKILEALEEHPEFAAIGGLYFLKGENGCAQIWGDVNDSIPNFRPQPPDPNGGLVECCGLGQGFTIFRMKMFHDKRLRKPWFKTQKDANGIATQDLHFWSDARKYGYRAAVHCGVKVGHMDIATGFVW